VGFTFDYESRNQDFVRLVMNENMHYGHYLEQSDTINDVNWPVINSIRDIYARGCKENIFRAGLDPVDIHASISALCFYNVSNQYTFSLIFRRDIMSPGAFAKRRSSVIDMILRYMQV